MDVHRDTERWVQCTRCSKWRCVADALQVSPGWHCALNVLSATHRTCAAPQEPMPDDGSDASTSPPPSGDVVAAAWTAVMGTGRTAAPVDDTADADDVFTRSECTCATCTSINAAVDTWAQGDVASLPPLLRCVVRAIDGTVPSAVAAEREKRFVHRPDDPDPPPG